MRAENCISKLSKNAEKLLLKSREIPSMERRKREQDGKLYCTLFNNAEKVKFEKEGKTSQACMYK